MSASHRSVQQSRLVRAGVLLFSVGIWTGLWSGLVLGGVIVRPLPRLALAAHLAALMGGLWLIAVAYSLNFVEVSDKRAKLVARLSIIPAWSNWLITLLASIVGENGLSFSGSMENRVIAVLLQVFVVIPALIGTVLWSLAFLNLQRKNQ